jgi:hypothetical protein
VDADAPVEGPDSVHAVNWIHCAHVFGRPQLFTGELHHPTEFLTGELHHPTEFFTGEVTLFTAELH